MAEIVVLSEQLEEKYNEFLLKYDKSLFYHSLKYRNFLKKIINGKDNYLIALENNDIKGVLPLFFIENKEHGRIYNSLPYYGSNGGVMSNNKEISLQLINEYKRIINLEESAGGTIIINPIDSQDYSTIENDFIDERISFWNDLSVLKSEEDLFNVIDSSTRRNIKKAKREGITVSIDNHQIDFLYKTHVSNMEAIGGKPKTKDFFNLIDSSFISGDDYDIYIAKKDEKIIAGLLVFYFKNTVEYFVPVIVSEFREYQPLSLIIYQAFLESAKRGFRLWNWGGTWKSQDGVYRFKKKWGGKEINYTYYINISNKRIIELNQEEIINEYPNFFVIPFSKLK
jgi:hypothetical protein